MKAGEVKPARKGEVKPEVEGKVTPSVPSDFELLSKSDLLATPRTKFVKLTGSKGVKIRAITPKELGQIVSKYKTDWEISTALISLAVLEPKLSKEDAENLRIDYAIKLGAAIAEFSGLPVRGALARALRGSGEESVPLSGSETRS